MSLPSQRAVRSAPPATHPLLQALARATALGTIAQRQGALLAARLPTITDAAERAHVTTEAAFLRLFEGAMASGAELCWAAARPTAGHTCEMTPPFDADEANTTLVLIWAAGLGERLERYRLILRATLSPLTDRGAQARMAVWATQAEVLLTKTRRLERDLLTAAGITEGGDG